jgi:hypothetical protein
MPDTLDEGPWMTAADAAEFLELDVSVLRSWVSRGLLRVELAPAGEVVPVAAVAQLYAARTELTAGEVFADLCDRDGLADRLDDAAHARVVLDPDDVYAALFDRS